jgi:AmmeMemoRadiSam system protein B
VRIVPILCGFIAKDPAFSSPERVTESEQFLDLCRAVASDPGRRVSVIAGADLSHVGRRFGHDLEINDQVVVGVEERDREDLDRVLRLDAEGFYGSVMKDGNARQVCGLGCIYAALRSIAPENRHGELLHYGYAHDPAGGIVSFAGLVVTAQPQACANREVLA